MDHDTEVKQVLMTASVETGLGPTKYLTLTPITIKSIPGEPARLCLPNEFPQAQNAVPPDVHDYALGDISQYEDSELDVKPNLNLTLCRICLEIGRKMYSLLDEEDLNMTYTDMVGLVGGLAGAGGAVCWECAHRLRCVAQFRRTVTAGLHLFNKYLNEGISEELLQMKRTNVRSRLVQSNTKQNHFDVFIQEQQRSEFYTGINNFMNQTKNNSINMYDNIEVKQEFVTDFNLAIGLNVQEDREKVSRVTNRVRKRTEGVSWEYKETDETPVKTHAQRQREYRIRKKIEKQLQCPKKIPKSNAQRQREFRQKQKLNEATIAARKKKDAKRAKRYREKLKLKKQCATNETIAEGTVPTVNIKVEKEIDRRK